MSTLQYPDTQTDGAKGAKTVANSTAVTLATDQLPIDIHLVGETNGSLPHAGIDAFGRLRVGQAYTLADIVMRYEIDARDWGQQTVTGGTITYLPNQQAANLAVTTASAASCVLQTHEYFRYQAGKAQWIRQTLYHADTGQTNQVRRWGYFDAQNGLFFQLSGTAISIVRRTYTSGSAVETTVAKANWNVDKLDGTGASGVTLDITKASIYEIEFQHLAVGNVAFRVNGILVHVMHHPNALSVPYMTSAQLPVRIESHGGTKPPEEAFGAVNSADITLSTTERPVLAIRPKLTYNSKTNRMSIIPIHLYVSNRNQNDYAFRVIINPATITKTASTPTWTSADARSGTEYCIDADGFTGGQTLSAAITAGISTTTVDLASLFNTDGRHLRLDAFGTIQDVLMIVASRVGNQDASARCSVHWNEVR
jgi:hypothetical protein